MLSGYGTAYCNNALLPLLRYKTWPDTVRHAVWFKLDTAMT